jgi:hypothetical protein
MAKPFDLSEKTIGVYDSIKLISGFTTAGPIGYLSIHYITNGDVVLAIPTLIVAIAVFWLPGWLMDQYIKQTRVLGSRIKSVSRQVINYIIVIPMRLVKQLLPFSR